jgi:hypothetical protein
MKDLLEVATALLMATQGLVREGLDLLDRFAARLADVFVGGHRDLTGGRGGPRSYNREGFTSIPARAI